MWPEPTRLPIALVALLAGGLAGPSVIEAAPPRASEPSVRFGSNEVEYGVLLQGEVVEKELVVHNDGSAVLEITKVTPSCGCTDIVSSLRRIEPGQRATLTFTIDSKRIKPGDSRKRIRLDTNDPQQPRADFFFTVDVVALYRSEPAQIRVEGLYDQEKRAKVRLIGTSEHGFELMGARSRGDEFEIEEFVALGIGEYELTLKVGAAETPGSLRDPLDLLIEVVDGRQVQVGQWVDIAHQDPVQVVPDVALQFGNKDTDALLREGADPVVKTVTLRSRDPERSFRVLEARTVDLPEGAFRIAVVPVKPGFHYTVQVTLPAYRDEAYLLGKLVIVTDAETEPERVLNLRARFGRKR